MPRLELTGLDELVAAIGRISKIPHEVQERALKAGADIAMAEIKSKGEALGVRDAESNIHILDKLKINKPSYKDDIAYTDITFAGTRTRGNKQTRNAEIAFINEYGDRKQDARQFIKTAMEGKADEITNAQAEVLGDWWEDEYRR